MNSVNNSCYPEISNNYIVTSYKVLYADMLYREFVNELSIELPHKTCSEIWSTTITDCIKRHSFDSKHTSGDLLSSKLYKLLHLQKN